MPSRSDFKVNVRRMLLNRAERMVRMLRQSPAMPDLILANEAVMIFKAAAALWPDMVGNSLAEELQQLVCRQNAYCITCRKHIGFNADREYCEECLADMKEECESHGCEWPREDN